MAGKCGEETESKVSDGAPPPGPSKYRACLIVSLIVLVWNVGASWRYFSPASPAIDCTASVPTGTLNVRQNFLLGSKVDVNRAGPEEISGLPGISDKVAESIVETRGRIGGFRRPEDLLLARGIKEKKLKKILPFLSGFNNN